MRRILIGAGLAVIGGALAWGGIALAGGDACARREPQRLVFFAVLEGCYDDGVSNADVDRILAPDPATHRPMHFVDGCPLCTPAVDALRLYRARPPLTHQGKRGGDTLGPGLQAHLAERLASTEMKERLDAVHSLISRWVTRRLGDLRPSADEQAEWARRLAEMATKGMAMLARDREAGRAGAYAPFETCAVCDAASSAARK